MAKDKSRLVGPAFPTLGALNPLDFNCHFYPF